MYFFTMSSVRSVEPSLTITDFREGTVCATTDRWFALWILPRCAPGYQNVAECLCAHGLVSFQDCCSRLKAQRKCQLLQSDRSRQWISGTGPIKAFRCCCLLHRREAGDLADHHRFDRGSSRAETPHFD